ncbi:MAG: RnfH family protein [Betaproteobacteria bacterium]|nr:RnfH family protein [Betaproteobacteria bacterium]
MRIRLLTATGESEHRLEPPVSLGEAMQCLLPTSTGGAAGIWGQARPPQTLLKEGDRIETYEALRADPKLARRRKVVRPKGARLGKM